MSSFTKKAIAKLWILRVLDLAFLLTPLAVYIGIALGNEGATYQKISVVGTVSVALILTIFNLITKKALRSPIWIILIGLYFALKEALLPLIILLAASTILDEFVFVPLINRTKVEVTSNKEMDKREKMKDRNGAHKSDSSSGENGTLRAKLKEE